MLRLDISGETLQPNKNKLNFFNLFNEVRFKYFDKKIIIY